MTDWAIVGLTAVLVLITGYYAWQSKRTADQTTRMVEELRLQRAEMSRQLAEMRRQTQLGFYRPRVAVLHGVRRALGRVATEGKVHYARRVYPDGIARAAQGDATVGQATDA